MSQYVIRTTRHYYAPAEDRVGYYVSDFEYAGDRARAKRMSRAAAESLAAELDAETYRCAHNESARPSYAVVRV